MSQPSSENTGNTDTSISSPAPSLSKRFSVREIIDEIEKWNDDKEKEACAKEEQEKEPEILKNSGILEPQIRELLVDNLRVALAVILIFHNSVLLTLANSPLNPENASPNQFTAIALWMGIYRSVFVSLMYFTSGRTALIATKFIGMGNYQFWLTRLRRTVFLCMVYYILSWIARYLYAFGGLESRKRRQRFTETQFSYYATEEGQLSLLYAPIYYLFFRLVLDTIYAVGRRYNQRRDNVLGKLVGNEGRYILTSIRVLVTLRLIYPILVRTGYISPIAFNGPLWITRYLPGIPIDADFPFPYIISYFMGVNFTTIIKFCTNQPSTGALYAAFSLPARLTFSAITLYPLYHYFPNYIPQAVSPNLPPHAMIVNNPRLFAYGSNMPWSNTAAILFTLWSAYTYSTLTEMVFSMLYSIRNNMLNRKWGRFVWMCARLVRIQMFVHMLVVIGLARHSSRWTAQLGLLSRCVLVGFGSVICTWGVTIASFYIYAMFNLSKIEARSQVARQRLMDSMPKSGGMKKIDIETGRPESAKETHEHNSAAKTNQTQNTMHVGRIGIIDKARALLIALLVVHTVLIEVISFTPGNVKQTHPRLFVFASFLTAFHRACVIPLFFFISGISSFISMSTLSMYRNVAPNFIIHKCGTAIYYQTAIFLLAQLIRLLFKREWHPLKSYLNQSVSYYATEDGKMAILYGPLRYFTALIIFDCVYAVGRDYNRHRTLPWRFLDSKKGFFFISLSLLLLQFIYPVFMPASFHIYHSASLLTLDYDDSKFPLLCVLAYFMGVNVTTLARCFYSKRTVSVRGILGGIVWRVLLLTTLLSVLYYRMFPVWLPKFFVNPDGYHYQVLRLLYILKDVRNAAACYTLWSMLAYVLFVDLMASTILYSPPTRAARTRLIPYALFPTAHPKWFMVLYVPCMHIICGWPWPTIDNVNMIFVKIFLLPLGIIYYTDSLAWISFYVRVKSFGFFNRLWIDRRNKTILENAALATKMLGLDSKVKESKGTSGTK